MPQAATALGVLLLGCALHCGLAQPHVPKQRAIDTYFHNEVTNEVTWEARKLHFIDSSCAMT